MSSDQPRDENQLVRQAKQGDAQAFGLLYTSYLDAIYRYIYFRVSNVHEAEDLTEEVFVKAWAALPDYEIRQFPFKSWLYRIAHNLVVDFHRKKRPDSVAEPEDYAGATAPSPTEELIEKKQAADILAEAVQELSEEEQQVILLRFVEEMPHEQVAAIIKKSNEASRVIQHRALAKLQEILKRKNA